MTSTSSENQSFREAEVNYSKAAKAELGRDLDQAFSLYIQSAQKFLHLSRTVSDDSARSKAKAEAGKALERAERIKAVRRDLTPVSRNPFATHEQLPVLIKSSVINGCSFPLWDNDPTDISLSSSDSASLIQPDLSPEHKKCRPIWRSPIDIWSRVSMASESLVPHDIIQEAVTDCSVCAAVAVCIDHHRRFDSKIGLSSMYPQGENQLPILSSSRNYALRVLINGGYRRITIDDKLPTISDGKLACMSAGPRNDIFPSLFEKAYIKLMGGYDFPGSNSSIDLRTLTGWIPEHIEIRSPRMEREKTWTRLLKGFTAGVCLLTAGTPNTVQTEWQGVQLLPAHNYAVIDVRETNNDRWVTLLNSWNHWARSDDTNNVDSALHSLSIAQDSGLLNMTWDDICTVFDSIYLNWNPRLFKYHIDFHGSWRLSTLDSDQMESSHRQLRLHLASDQEADGELWVLLTRHTVDRSRTPEYISIRVHDEDAQTIQHFETNKLALEGTYTNSPHCLIRMRVDRSQETLCVIASYDGDYSDVYFTVEVYSSGKVQWDETIPNTPFSKKTEGMLTTKNAGGNCSFPTFMINPQYHLRIHPKATNDGSQSQVRTVRTTVAEAKAAVAFTAQGARAVPWNVTIVWSKGERIFEIVQSDVAANSGAYSYGVAGGIKHLPAGDYTIILSAFQPDHLGPFVLRVDSSHRFDLEAIPQEGAGMYTKILRGVWDMETAAGGPSSKRYFSNPTYRVQVTRPTQIKIRLQLLHPFPSTAINVTLFASPPFSPLSTPRTGRKQVLTSGPYSDALSGAVTPQAPLEPGTYDIVPSTYTPGLKAAFRVSVYSSAAVEVELMS